MKTTTGEAMRGHKRWPAPNSIEAACRSEFPRENFDEAPYPFAIVLGATTTLLVIATVRSLWVLFTT